MRRKTNRAIQHLLSNLAALLASLQPFPAYDNIPPPFERRQHPSDP
jgi:hypothetical protein